MVWAVAILHDRLERKHSRIAADLIVASILGAIFLVPYAEEAAAFLPIIPIAIEIHWPIVTTFGDRVLRRVRLSLIK